MFDPAIGFFQGRAASGRWKSSPDEYDPRVWGHEHDYTETDGWNFAFHVPQDGQGLANLYGGRAALARKLDAFFATPETATFTGSYGGTIHEMLEARDVRMGQWGFSNQVSHHIPWMYDYAGQPGKTQANVREALRRLYSGSEIGQGYAGDEDNGETSAWYLFAAAACTRCRWEPELRHRLAAVQEGDDPPARAGHRGPRAEQQHAQRVRAGPAGQRPALEQDVPAALDARQRRHARRSTWARGRPAGRPTATPRRRR